jgi:hypothetical protein
MTTVLRAISRDSDLEYASPQKKFEAEQAAEHRKAVIDGVNS